VVNYSLSPGVIVSTGCSSQFTLIPTAVFITLLSFFPVVIGFISSVPSVVIGGVMAYIMASQVVAGLMVAFQDARENGFQFERGLVIGLPLLLGTVVAFLEPSIIDSLPVILKPILGNGFVVGVISALILEHLIFRQ
jgi:xanthine/uracil permease